MKVILATVIVSVVAFGIAAFFQFKSVDNIINMPNKALKLTTQTTGVDFPLNDNDGEYSIRELNGKYTLNYKDITGTTRVIYINTASSVRLDGYLNRPVQIQGYGKNVMQNVQCFAAPCPPVEVTELVVTSIAEK